MHEESANVHAGALQCVKYGAGKGAARSPKKDAEWSGMSHDGKILPQEMQCRKGCKQLPNCIKFCRALASNDARLYTQYTATVLAIQTSVSSV